MAPGIAVGHALGRWSCFFAGCCYGKPTDLPWGITFTDIHSFAPKGVSLHPVQVYESMGELTIFGILMASRKWKRFDGQLFLSYLGLYSFLRFVTEFFRGDDRGHFFSEHLSPAQGISILVLATVAVSYLLSRRTKTAG
jgi:phosphatidylglycerol:prolipoprotein diacylglycerol transferase